MNFSAQNLMLVRHYRTAVPNLIFYYWNLSEGVSASIFKFGGKSKKRFWTTLIEPCIKFAKCLYTLQHLVLKITKYHSLSVCVNVAKTHKRKYKITMVSLSYADTTICFVATLKRRQGQTSIFPSYKTNLPYAKKSKVKWLCPGSSVYDVTQIPMYLLLYKVSHGFRLMKRDDYFKSLLTTFVAIGIF